MIFIQNSWKMNFNFIVERRCPSELWREEKENHRTLCVSQSRIVTWSDRERAHRSLWSFLVPTIGRKFSAKRKFPLHRPSAAFSRRCFSLMSSLDRLNSRDSRPMDRCKADCDRRCEEEKFLEEEILNILWSVVACRRCTASADSTEGRDNNRPNPPDELDWIPIESKLNERTLERRKGTRRWRRITWNRFRFLRQRRWFAEIGEKLQNIFVSQSIALLFVNAFQLHDDRPIEIR